MVPRWPAMVLLLTKKNLERSSATVTCGRLTAILCPSDEQSLLASIEQVA
jgi:hypothetical protein